MNTSAPVMDDCTAPSGVAIAQPFTVKGADPLATTDAPAVTTNVALAVSFPAGRYPVEGTASETGTAAGLPSAPKRV